MQTFDLNKRFHTVQHYSSCRHTLYCFIFSHLQSVCCKGVMPAVGVVRAGAWSSLEEQAYMLLTETERQTMGYYIQEYQRAHIGVEPLAMALFELFNTHAKVRLTAKIANKP